jgi:diaminopimelate epimerase
LKFEKWQALGNDYLIVERDDLPFDLTPERIRRICEPHMGVGSDGILLLDKPTQRGYVASLRIFNPDGSEAELSGNGAREAIMYLRRAGWTDSDTFSIETAAGEIRPTITGADTCRVDMGRAKLVSKDPMGSRTSTYRNLDRRSKPTRSSPAGPTSRSGTRSKMGKSERGSSKEGWGRRSPPARARAAPPSPTC